MSGETGSLLLWTRVLIILLAALPPDWVMSKWIALCRKLQTSKNQDKFWMVIDRRPFWKFICAWELGWPETTNKLTRKNYANSNVSKWSNSQRAKKVSFTACPSGKLYLSSTNPKVIFTWESKRRRSRVNCRGSRKLPQVQENVFS